MHPRTSQSAMVIVIGALVLTLILCAWYARDLSCSLPYASEHAKRMAGQCGAAAWPIPMSLHVLACWLEPPIRLAAIRRRDPRFGPTRWRAPASAADDRLLLPSQVRDILPRAPRCGDGHRTRTRAAARTRSCRRAGDGLNEVAHVQHMVRRYSSVPPQESLVRPWSVLRLILTCLRR